MRALPAAVAIDAGGSTTRALVVTRDGTCGPVVRSGRGNPVSDPHRAASNIAEASLGAIEASHHAPTMVMAAVAGTVSRDFPELVTELRAQSLPQDISIVSDLLAAYFSATPLLDGLVLIVGTGAVAARIEDGDLVAIRDGLGWLLGDDGSGFWMGHRVARAVAAELDGRGPATSLTPRLLQQMPATRPRAGARREELTALLSWSQSGTPVELSALAVLAAEESAADPVAAAICEEAARHVLATLSSLRTEDRGQDEGVPVVLGGGVLEPGGPVGHRVHAALDHQALSVSDGMAGAAMLAVRRLGGTADATMLAHISRQLLAR